MAYAQIPRKPPQRLLLKYLADQSQILMAADVARRPCRIRHRNSAGLLPTVLQGAQPVIDIGRHVAAAPVINAEDAAFLLKARFFCFFCFRMVCLNPFRCVHLQTKRGREAIVMTSLPFIFLFYTPFAAVCK